ncbi:MAG: 2OG-Fe(II) oxygenase, partial [Planctomycetota bacterium]|nr:2OG-Fe(II) oxygenase [Planctomycetota bacterium]
MTNRYLEAVAKIPRGETRSFSELAVMAGRPGAARAAGRALRECSDDASTPWHRVVAAGGALDRDEGRARLQLRRLRREGARPRVGESVRAWARRVHCRLVASYDRRVFLPARDERVVDLDPARVDRVPDEATAIARGFRPIDAPEGAGYPDPARLRVPRARAKPRRTLAARLADRDWEALRVELLGRGWFRLRALLSAAECAEILADAGRANRFERSIVMAPRGYGVGAYHYFREPLAEPAGELRGELYTRLRPAARELSGREYPATLAAFWRRCRAAGQHRSSSIVL